MTSHLIVDTDTGIDDALALLYLAGRPDLSIDAITSVYGNCVVEDALRNIAHVLDLIGRPDIPVARGADGPMIGDAHIAHYVHGHDGLGDVVPPDEKHLPGNLLAADSAETLVMLANDRLGYHDLLTLGPLTNVGLALQQDPLLLTKFRQVVIMGGSGPFPEPGTSLMIDANMQNDAAAATLVFTAPCERRVMVGVNVTRTVITDEDSVKKLRNAGTPTARFAAAVLESYHDFYRFAWGRRISPVHDGLAAAIALDPSLIVEAPVGPVNVTTDGFATRAHLMRTSEGRPVAWPVAPAPDTVCVTEVDVERFQADFLATLIGGPVS